MKTLALSSWKNLSNVFYKQLQEFTSRSRFIYRTHVSPLLRYIRRLRTLLGWTIVSIFTLTSAQMILTQFWTLLGSWLPVVAVVAFFLTTSLWLLVVLEEKTSGQPWIIFRRDSK